MKILKEYINFIVENNQSFLDIYNSYVDEQKPREEDQQQEDQQQEDQQQKKDDLSMLVDPYEYLNFPAKK